MSTLLEVIAVTERPNGHDLDVLLRELTDSISRKMNGFRIVRRPVADGVRIEPFLAGSSLAALIENRARRTEALLALRELGMTCFLSFESVRFTKYNAAKPEERADFGITDIDSALDLLLGNRVVTVGIEPPHIVFGFYQVEARLFTPTMAPDGEIVTGFFCNMEAVSLNEKQALEFVAHALTAESAALVDWQKIDVVELGNDKAPGAYRVGGRVFFDGKTFDA